VPAALAIHGGAWNIPDEAVDAHLAGISAILHDTWDLLLSGASALDVVETAVRMLEDDPTFNAGRGSHLNRAGTVELDASIMDGSSLDAGAVAAAEMLRHPVTVARRVMERSPHVLLVGKGARQFARRIGAEVCRTRDLLVGRELERYLRVRRGERDLVELEFRTARESLDRPSDTVGAVAVDRRGRTAAATSTGGTQDKEPGRAGDTGIIGAGTYADDRSGAASCTGWGESILRVVLAKSAVDRLTGGMSPSHAARSALATVKRVRGRAGLILVDRKGRAAASFNTPRMARGIATESSGIQVSIGKGRRR
jgi:beta-aspartyl-peptidase (threonine type)